MSTWTPAALTALESWLGEARARLGIRDDTDEIVGELRAHVETEVERSKIELVTVDDFARIAQRVGLPESREEPPKVRTGSGFLTPPAPSAPIRSRNTLGGALLVFGGILLPLAALVVELGSGIWGDMAVDPIPSPLYVALIAFVPLVHGVVFATLGARFRAALAAAEALATVVVAFYAIVFLPHVAIAALGVLMMGLGFLPLSPFLGLPACVVAWQWIRHAGPIPKWGPLRADLWGWIGGVLLIGGVEGQDILTSRWVEQAVSSDPEVRISAVRSIRAFGSEASLLALGRGGSTQWRWLPKRVFARDLARDASPSAVTPDAAQLVWYRVTGRPFPAALPFDREGEVSLSQRRAASGIRTASPIVLHSSRLDGQVDASGHTAYFEWIFELRSSSPIGTEGRCELLLPAGGVVSRATLWVNGDEQEAAFAKRSTTVAAFESVQEQRRDPLLVTTAGADRVSLRCFPVSSQGLFKARIGITAPWTLESATDGAMRLPQLVESNFDRTSAPMSVIVDAPAGLDVAIEGCAASTLPDGRRSFRGTHAAASSFPPAARVRGADFRRGAWGDDPTTKLDNTVALQRASRRDPLRPTRIAVVVDGSAAMDGAIEGVASALEKLPAGVESALLFAGDAPVDLGDGAQINSAERASSLARALRNESCAGGADSVAALVRAWNLASASDRGVVLFIHGPIHRAVSPVASLAQLLEMRPDQPLVYDCVAVPGPDRISASLENRQVRSVARVDSLERDLARTFEQWTGARERWAFQWTRVERSAVGDAAPATDHIGRLWAKEEVDRLTFPDAPDRHAKAVEIAARHALVTTVSGAVALETRQQFNAFGLTPADPNAAPRIHVPGVPEPEEWALLIVGSLALLVFFIRRRA